jgi:hypothetical protein
VCTVLPLPLRNTIFGEVKQGLLSCSPRGVIFGVVKWTVQMQMGPLVTLGLSGGVVTSAADRSGRRRRVVEVGGVERRGEAWVGGGEGVGCPRARVIGGEGVVGLGALSQHVGVVGS